MVLAVDTDPEIERLQIERLQIERLRQMPSW